MDSNAQTFVLADILFASIIFLGILFFLGSMDNANANELKKIQMSESKTLMLHGNYVIEPSRVIPTYQDADVSMTFMGVSKGGDALLFHCDGRDVRVKKKVGTTFRMKDALLKITDISPSKKIPFVDVQRLK